MTRLVVDASALLSGVVSSPSSPPARLLTAAREGAFESIACPQLLTEFQKGLAKPYFVERVEPEEARQIVKAFELVAVTLPDPSDPPQVLRDADDDYLVALAVKAGAEAIVSGDHDLLHHAQLTPPAIDARAACEMLGLLDR